MFSNLILVVIILLTKQMLTINVFIVYLYATIIIIKLVLSTNYCTNILILKGIQMILSKFER